jgi:hypothetical protein
MRAERAKRSLQKSKLKKSHCGNDEREPSTSSSS